MKEAMEAAIPMLHVTTGEPMCLVRVWIRVWIRVWTRVRAHLMKIVESCVA